MTPRERALARQQLVGQLHAAADAVHRLTGRTDQHLDEIVALYPHHEAVKALEAARAALRADVDGSA
jgi:hypothetical protein